MRGLIHSLGQPYLIRPFNLSTFCGGEFFYLYPHNVYILRRMFWLRLYSQVKDVSLPHPLFIPEL